MIVKKVTYSKFWTFEQALAWVLYRREDIVSYVGPGSSGSLRLVAMYPTHFGPQLEKIGKSNDLLAALQNGNVIASGCHDANVAERQEIRPEDWLDLRHYGGKVFRISDDGKRTLYPWHDIALESEKVKKHWRSQSEVTGRTRYDWKTIKEIHDEVKSQNPNISQNELITEIAGGLGDSQMQTQFHRSNYGIFSGFFEVLFESRSGH